MTVVFALNGVMFGSLFARMPTIKSDLGLSEGELGLGLLCGSAGLIVSQPLAGALSTRIGSRPLTALGLLLYGGLLALPALSPGLASFALAFFVLGAGSGLLDVAMNAQGAMAEERHSRAIFSSFHAAFSFGAMGGAALAAGAAALDVDPTANLLAIGAIAIAAGLPVIRGMLAPSHDADPGDRLFARPSGALAVLGAIAFCAAMSEGAVSDWSGILLAEWRGASDALAAAGLAAFSAAMAVGRLVADPLRERFGAARLIQSGAAIAIAGMSAVVAPLGIVAAVAGFALAGLGLSALFPIALLLGSRTPGHSPAAGIAAVSTAGYAGFLAGPALIGLSAEATSLPASLGLLIALALAVVVLARHAEPRA